jgi:hypothetical protein
MQGLKLYLSNFLHLYLKLYLSGKEVLEKV